MAFYYISCMRIFLIQFVILLLINDLSGMECEFGHESSFLDKFNVVNPTSCPTILDSDKEYCCKSGNRVYCCDAGEFLGNGFFIGDGVKNYIKDHFATLEHSSYQHPTNYFTSTTVSRSEESFGVLLPVLIGVAVVLLIVCCLCCLCCPCCLLYKRRHRGTVYGNVLQPGVQTVVAVQQPAQQQAPIYPPQPTPMPMPAPGYSQPAYPVYPPQQGQQPPPYSEATAHELYTKQSPYNPSFQ